MPRGTIKFLDLNRGFGFIVPDLNAVDQRDGELLPTEDVFLGARRFPQWGQAVKGDRVVFDVEESRRKIGKLEATNVRLVR
jgi:cold shock CspA family protein